MTQVVRCDCTHINPRRSTSPALARVISSPPAQVLEKALLTLSLSSIMCCATAPGMVSRPSLSIQCIHGIDNDGLDTMPGAVAQHIIDDRDNVSKAFSRTCAGGEDITRASAGDVDRLGLMCVQSQRTTCVIVFRFIFAENSRAFTMKNALRYKPFDRLSASK